MPVTQACRQIGYALAVNPRARTSTGVALSGAVALALGLGCFVDGGGDATSGGGTDESASSTGSTTVAMCTPGESGCKCDDGACEDGLACQGGICRQPAGSTTGVDPTTSPTSATESTGVECRSCPLVHPNVLVILDFSTSTNVQFGPATDNVTRWLAEKSLTLGLREHDGGALWTDVNLAVMRFGHAPDPDVPGTPIPSDGSGIVDGQALDHLWYDASDPLVAYRECNAGLQDTLSAIGAPLGGASTGIGTWTRGALEFARDVIQVSRALHPDDDAFPTRHYAIVLLTDGQWTNADGMGQDPEYDPTLVAGSLNADDGVPVHVVFFGDLGGEAESDAQQIASAGGTGVAWLASDLASFDAAMTNVFSKILTHENIITSECCDPVCAS